MTYKELPGERVATAIAVVKWVLIMLAAVSAILGAASVALQDNSVSYALTVAVVILAVAGGWSLFVWVLFGWFEHTLLALVAIARHTAPPVPLSAPAAHERIA